LNEKMRRKFVEFYNLTDKFETTEMDLHSFVSFKSNNSRKMDSFKRVCSTMVNNKKETQFLTPQKPPLYGSKSPQNC